MSSDKLVLVVVALAVVLLSTAVASLLTDCLYSTWSSNAAEYSDRASYSREDCEGEGVGDTGMQEKGF